MQIADESALGELYDRASVVTLRHTKAAMYTGGWSALLGPKFLNADSKYGLKHSHPRRIAKLNMVG